MKRKLAVGKFSMLSICRGFHLWCNSQFDCSFANKLNINIKYLFGKYNVTQNVAWNLNDLQFRNTGKTFSSVWYYLLTESDICLTSSEHWSKLVHLSCVVAWRRFHRNWPYLQKVMFCHWNVLNVVWEFHASYHVNIKGKYFRWFLVDRSTLGNVAQPRMFGATHFSMKKNKLLFAAGFSDKMNLISLGVFRESLACLLHRSISQNFQIVGACCLLFRPAACSELARNFDSQWKKKCFY